MWEDFVMWHLPTTCDELCSLFDILDKKWKKKTDHEMEHCIFALNGMLK